MSETANPFVPNTTSAIERANRLVALRSHPGFIDLLRLSLELVQQAADICADYPGWDAQQIVVLKVRMQAAKEHHQALLAKIQNAIEIGVAEASAQAQSFPEKTAEEILDQGDHVRRKVLEHFEEADGRLPGSY